MIVRRHDNDLLLLAQHDHSALAGRIVAAWRADGLPARATRDRVIQATILHDIGWKVDDEAPVVDAETGEPISFMTTTMEGKQRPWGRAIDIATPQDPYVAALIAQHGATVYRRYLDTAGWESFFPTLEARRDALLATQAIAREDFLRDYANVTVGDLCSLVFCDAWEGTHAREGYQVVLHRSQSDSEDPVGASVAGASATDANVVDGGWLQITPDPFDGAIVPLDISGRRIPARRYASDADLRDTLAKAPIVRITGTAAGAPPAATRA
jgi:hypothetical protein